MFALLFVLTIYCLAVTVKSVLQHAVNPCIRITAGALFSLAREFGYVRLAVSAATKLQAHARRFRARKQYRKTLFAVIKIQATFRASRARKDYRRQIAGFRLLQAIARGASVRSTLSRKKTQDANDPLKYLLALLMGFFKCLLAGFANWLACVFSAYQTSKTSFEAYRPRPQAAIQATMQKIRQCRVVVQDFWLVYAPAVQQALQGGWRTICSQLEQLVRFGRQKARQCRAVIQDLWQVQVSALTQALQHRWRIICSQCEHLVRLGCKKTMQLCEVIQDIWRVQVPAAQQALQSRWRTICFKWVHLVRLGRVHMKLVWPGAQEQLKKKRRTSFTKTFNRLGFPKTIPTLFIKRLGRERRCCRNAAVPPNVGNVL